eukprot:gene1595-972_t
MCAAGPSGNPAQAPDWHVAFLDSSDEDNSHEADVSILSAGSSSVPSEEQAPGALQRYGGALIQGARQLVRALARDNRKRSNHPNEPISSESERSEEEGSLDYGASQFQEETDPNAFIENEEPVVDDEVGVDLRETISQYRRTPDSFYLNIILAALRSGVVVDGVLVAEANGCPTLLQVLMESDTILEDDEDLQSIIQEEINRVLSGDPYNGDYVPATEAAYLHTLCRVHFARVNMRQMVLMRYSGFSFIEILVDYPHLLQNATSPKSWQIRVFRTGYFFHTIIHLLGWIPTVLLNPAIFVMCVYWFLSDQKTTATGQSSATSLAEQNKIRVYARSASWGYPDNYYVMFPILPLYKLILAIACLKYDNLPDNKRYIVIRHDLYAGVSIQQMAEGLYAATPQLVLQLFLYATVDDHPRVMKITLHCLVAVAIISAFCGMFSYIRYATYSHSCDTFGFALLTVEDFYIRKRGLTIPILPTNIMTRLVQFFTMAFCVTAFVTLLIDVVNVKGCNKWMVVIVAASLLLTLITSISQILIIINLPFSRLNALVALPIMVIFAAFMVYHTVLYKDGATCITPPDSFFPTWHLPVVVFFTFTFAVFVVWVVSTLIEVCRHRRILQRSVDSCFWQTCSYNCFSVLALVLVESKQPKKQPQQHLTSFHFSLLTLRTHIGALHELFYGIEETYHSKCSFYFSFVCYTSPVVFRLPLLYYCSGATTSICVDQRAFSFAPTNKLRNSQLEGLVELLFFIAFVSIRSLYLSLPFPLSFLMEQPEKPREDFVFVEPTFNVIGNFSDLQSTIRRLHRPFNATGESILANSASPSPETETRQSANSVQPQPQPGESRRPRVLCLWDIDDTLLSSGDYGVRQNLMFEEHQLLGLFRSMPRTRHLLLSQGSVDDVFLEPGRLAFLRNFFLSEKFEDGDTDEEEDQFAETNNWFGCCSSGPPIHLTKVDSCRKELSCDKWDAWGPHDRESNPVRWLILRPGMWGISLARLSSMIPPSGRTAFVDGKYFRKLDIAWSLAASGNWDRVFFVDNNLCEVGIIRYGMSYSTAASTLERRRADKVFLADFTLLKASAKLYAVEREKGRRITYPEEEGESDRISSPFAPVEDFPSSSPAGHPTQTVQLHVANVHFQLMDYYRVSHCMDRGEPELLAMLSRQCGHPTFFEDQCFYPAYYQAENAIDQIIMEDLRLYGTVGKGWKHGWTPNSSKVVMPFCKTIIQMETVYRLCAHSYRLFVNSICGQLTQARKAKRGHHQVQILSTARKECYAIYSDFLRGCPVIDPLFTVELALTLYQLHFSDDLPSKRKIEALRSMGQHFLFLHDPNGESATTVDTHASLLRMCSSYHNKLRLWPTFDFFVPFSLLRWIPSLPFYWTIPYLTTTKQRTSSGCIEALRYGHTVIDNGYLVHRCWDGYEPGEGMVCSTSWRGCKPLGGRSKQFQFSSGGIRDAATDNPAGDVVAPIAEAVGRCEDAMMVLAFPSNSKDQEPLDGSTGQTTGLKTSAAALNGVSEVVLGLCAALLRSSFAAAAEDFKNGLLSVVTVSAQERVMYDEIQRKTVKHMADIESRTVTAETVEEMCTLVLSVLTARHEAVNASPDCLASQTACVASVALTTGSGLRRVSLVHCSSEQDLLAAMSLCLRRLDGAAAPPSSLRRVLQRASGRGLDGAAGAQRPLHLHVIAIPQPAVSLTHTLRGSHNPLGIGIGIGIGIGVGLTHSLSTTTTSSRSDTGGEGGAEGEESRRRVVGAGRTANRSEAPVRRTRIKSVGGAPLPQRPPHSGGDTPAHPTGPPRSCTTISQTYMEWTSNSAQDRGTGHSSRGAVARSPVSHTATAPVPANPHTGGFTSVTSTPTSASSSSSSFMEATPKREAVPPARAVPSTSTSVSHVPVPAQLQPGRLGSQAPHPSSRGRFELAGQLLHRCDTLMRQLVQLSMAVQTHMSGAGRRAANEASFASFLRLVEEYHRSVDALSRSCRHIAARQYTPAPPPPSAAAAAGGASLCLHQVVAMKHVTAAGASTRCPTRLRGGALRPAPRLSPDVLSVGKGTEQLVAVGGAPTPCTPPSILKTNTTDFLYALHRLSHLFFRCARGALKGDKKKQPNRNYISVVEMGLRRNASQVPPSVSPLRRPSFTSSPPLYIYDTM